MVDVAWRVTEISDVGAPSEVHATKQGLARHAENVVIGLELGHALETCLRVVYVLKHFAAHDRVESLPQSHRLDADRLQCEPMGGNACFQFVDKRLRDIRRMHLGTCFLQNDIGHMSFTAAYLQQSLWMRGVEVVTDLVVKVPDEKFRQRVRAGELVPRRPYDDTVFNSHVFHCLQLVGR